MLAVFAFGTWGDVKPLLLLLQHTMAKGSHQEATLVTHIEHDKNVRTILEEYYRMIHIHYTNAVACDTGCSSSFSVSDMDHVLVSISTDTTLSLVFANLFSLEGFIVAEAASVPCVFVHAHKPISRFSAAQLSSEFETRAPHLCRKLCTKGTAAGQCLWVDYCNWLWPTVLSERYDDIREMLHIPAIDSDEYCLPQVPLVLLAVSPRLFYIDTICNTGEVVQSAGEAAGRLDLGNNVRVCGAISSISSQYKGEAEFTKACDDIPLSTFVTRQKMDSRMLICVDFGSMTKLLDQSIATGDGDGACSTRCSMGSVSPFHRFVDCLRNLPQFAFIVICHDCTGMRNALSPYMWDESEVNSTTSDDSSSAANVAMAGQKRSRTMNSEKTSIVRNERNIYVISGDYSHTLLFPECAGVITHGGAGSVASATLLGIPQIVVPLIHDQFVWSKRLEQLGLTVSQFSSEVLFPHFLKKVQEQPVVSQAEALLILSRLLHATTSSSHRLKCGCIGISLRNDPLEQGLENAAAEITTFVSNCSTHPSEAPGQQSRLTTNDLSTKLESLHSEIVLPNSLIISTPCVPPTLLSSSSSASTVQSEVDFMYEEIFSQRCYVQHGIKIPPGGLVVDAAMEQKSICVVAIEPVSETFCCLKRNLSKYCPNSILYKMALCACPCDDIGARSTNMNMIFFPHLSGNSCAEQLLPWKMTHCNRYLAKWDEASRDGDLVGDCHPLIQEQRRESCLCGTISDILDSVSLTVSQIAAKSYIQPKGKVCGSQCYDKEIILNSLSTWSKYQMDNVAGSSAEAFCSERKRISLLKVDVEGSELETLKGIRHEHWMQIDQLVVETTVMCIKDVVELLSSLSNEVEMTKASGLESSLELVEQAPDMISHRFGIADGKSTLVAVRDHEGQGTSTATSEPIHRCLFDVTVDSDHINTHGNVLIFAVAV